MFSSVQNAPSRLTFQSSSTSKLSNNPSLTFGSKFLKKLMGSDSFTLSSSSPKKVVEAGYSHRIQNNTNTLLETSGLAVCSAVMLLKDYDTEAKVYKDRMMFHLLGGELDLGYEDTQPGRKIENWLQEASRDPGPKKMIIVTGEDAEGSSINNTYQGRKLLQDCWNAPQMETESRQASSLETVTLQPNGKIKIRSTF